MTAREVSEVPGLRDAIADEVERNFGFFGNLHGKAIPVGSQTYRDIADVAIATLRTLLTEHPEALMQLGFARAEHGQGFTNSGLVLRPAISEEREG